MITNSSIYLIEDSIEHAKDGYVYVQSGIKGAIKDLEEATKELNTLCAKQEKIFGGIMFEEGSGTKGFFIPGEAWYADIIHEKMNYITIGIYNDDGSAEGEFQIKFKASGAAELRVSSRDWGVLGKMPELVGLLARIKKSGKTPEIGTLKKKLKELGYKDMTERERRDEQ